MSVPQFKARVDRICELTHDVRELQLRLLGPPQIDFKAGQFISFKIHRKDRPVPASRPYSIASPPKQREVITLVFNLVQGGPGSTFLFGLKEGEEVCFSGPAGQFYLHEDRARDYLFVATDTRMAPIRSVIYDLFERHVQNSVTLFWGLRSERDLYYQDELHSVAQTHANLLFLTTLSRTGEQWRGERGRVARLVKEQVPTVDNLAVYLCGSSGMIRDVTKMIRGKDRCPIYREKFYDDAGDANL